MPRKPQPPTTQPEIDAAARASNLQKQMNQQFQPDHLHETPPPAPTTIPDDPHTTVTIDGPLPITGPYLTLTLAIPTPPSLPDRKRICRPNARWAGPINLLDNALWAFSKISRFYDPSKAGFYHLSAPISASDTTWATLFVRLPKPDLRKLAKADPRWQPC